MRGFLKYHDLGWEASFRGVNLRIYGIVSCYWSIVTYYQELLWDMKSSFPQCDATTKKSSSSRYFTVTSLSFFLFDSTLRRIVTPLLFPITVNFRFGINLRLILTKNSD